LRKTRFLSEGGFETFAGELRFALGGIGAAKIHPGFGVVTAQMDGGLEIGDGFVQVAGVDLKEGEIVVGARVLGIDVEAALQIEHGVGGVAEFGEVATEIVVGEVIVDADVGGAAKETGGVAPVANFDGGAKGAKGERESGEEADDGSNPRAVEGEVADGPGDHDEHANEREVAVAVGHGLFADLDEADGGNEDAEEPEPAEEEVGLGSAAKDAQNGEGDKEEDGADDDPERPLVDVGIKDAEAGGPKHFHEIAGVGDGGVFDAGFERIDDKRLKGAGLLLGDDSDDAGGGAEEEEGNFFENQARDGHGATEGPEVKKKKNAGKRDEHGLGHEAEGKNGDGGGVE